MITDLYHRSARNDQLLETDVLMNLADSAGHDQALNSTEHVIKETANTQQLKPLTISKLF